MPMDATIVPLLTLILLNTGCIRALVSPFFITPERMHLSSIHSYCMRRAGRLITIDTKSKWERVLAADKQYHNNTISTDKLFIGLDTKLSNCTNYTWITGEPMVWSHWDLDDNQPRSCSTKRCVKMIYTLFSTSYCDIKRRGLCEYVTSVSDIKTTMRITTPVPNSDSSTTNISTNISCTRRQTNGTQLSEDELQSVITQLKAELAVSKNNTSINRRRRISVYDSRPSSMVMGGVASIVMSVVIGWIIVPDIVKMCAFLYKYGKVTI